MNRLRLSILSIFLCMLSLGSGAFAQAATTETKQQSNSGEVQNRMTEEERQQEIINTKRIREQRTAARNNFFDKYKLNRTFFKLMNLKPETVVKLARQELKTFILNDQRDGTFDMEVQTAQTGFRGGRGGLDTQPIAQIEETIVPIQESNSVMLSATDETRDKIKQLIQSVDDTQSAPVSRPFRIELVLLRGVAKSAVSSQSSTSQTQEIGVSVPIGGTVIANHVVGGQWVKAGDVLLELDSADADRQLKDFQGNMEIDMQKLAMAKQSAEIAQKMFDGGKLSREELNPKTIDVLDAQRQIQNDLSNIQRLEDMRKSLTVVAPISGRIVRQETKGINYRIEPNTQIVTIAEPIPSSSKPLGAVPPPDAPFDLKKIGLDANDLSEFGNGSYTILSRSVVSLGASVDTPEGSASVSLPDCRCFLSFISAQDPFVVIRVQLENVKDKQSLMESTLFLSPDKPGILGVTNLNDTLVLVARRKD